MKNRVFIFLRSFLIIGSALVLAGCGTTQIAYKSSAPPEKLCTLILASSLTVKNFNGESVDWRPSSGFIFGDAWSQVEIPEGNHVFKLNVHMRRPATIRSDFVITANDVIFKHDGFVAGRTYQMEPQIPGSKFYNEALWRGTNVPIVIEVKEVEKK